MSPALFEGIKLVANNGLSQNFQVSHTFTMAASSPSSYRYGATYVGGNHTSPTEVGWHALSQIFLPIVKPETHKSSKAPLSI